MLSPIREIIISIYNMSSMGKCTPLLSSLYIAYWHQMHRMYITAQCTSNVHEVCVVANPTLKNTCISSNPVLTRIELLGGGVYDALQKS